MTPSLHRPKPSALNAAERSVLGACLRWPSVIGDVAQLITPESFASEPHALVFAAIVTLWDSGKAVDAVTVADHLYRAGKAADAGGYTFLAALLDLEPTGAHALHHARIVREHSLCRRLAAEADVIARDAGDQTASADELLEQAEQRIFALSQLGANGSAVTLSQAIVEAFDAMETRRNSPSGTAGVPAGLLDLDRMTGGWQPGELVLLAARPSVGKSWMALSLVRNAARCGTPVFFASLEMSRLELAQRLLASEARVELQLIRRGRASRDEQELLLQAAPPLRSCPVHIDDTPGQSMLRIGANARRLKAKAGVGLVVIDYLQLISPANLKAPRHEQVGEISRRLKCLARELSVPVIALAQLNRASEEHDRPRLSDLRESGSLEQDGDTVLLLHHPKPAPGSRPPLPSAPKLLEVIIAKQRNGPTGDVPVVFHRATGRFENYAEDNKELNDE